MLSKWNHECRSYSVFCISKVTPRIAPDDLIVVIVLKIRIYIALLFFVFS